MTDTRTDWMLASLTLYVDRYEEYEEMRRNVSGSGGEAVRLIRERMGLGLRQCAADLEVSPSYLSKVERGKEMLSPELARRLLCRYHLGITPRTSDKMSQRLSGLL